MIDNNDQLLYSGTIAMAGEKPAVAPELPYFRPYVLTNFEDLTNGDIFTLAANSIYEKASPRGYLTYNAATGKLVGTDYIASGDQTAQQFAIIKDGSDYYLWNVKSHKFVPANSVFAAGTMGLVATPNGSVSFENAGDNSLPNHWYVKCNGASRYLQVNTGHNVFADAKSSDVYGSAWFIEAVGQLSAADLAAAQNAIEEYKNPSAEAAVDVTIDLYRDRGTYYTNADCTGTSKAGNTFTGTSNVQYKAWKLNPAGVTDVNGNAIPGDLNLVFSSTGNYNAVGYYIQVNNDAYKYNNNSGIMPLSIQTSKTQGEFNISVPDGYYILSYDFKVKTNTNGWHTTFTTASGEVVTTGNPGSVASWTIADVPCAQSTSFTSEITGGTNYGANTGASTTTTANVVKFQVRVVNTVWLKDKAREALAVEMPVGVGYPKTTSQAYIDLANLKATLQTALDAGDYSTLAAAILGFDSKKTAYYDCTDVMLPEAESKVYTISFVKGDGMTKYRLRYDANGYQIAKADNAPVGAELFYVYDLGNGKMAFRNFANKWLVIKNGRGQNSQKGYLDTRDDTYCGFTVSKLATGQYVTLGREFLFGRLAMNARTNDSSIDYFIISDNNSPGFGNSGAPYYNGSYTSAMVFEEVSEADRATGMADMAAGFHSTYGDKCGALDAAAAAGDAAAYFNALEDLADIKFTLSYVDEADQPLATGVRILAEGGRANDVAQTVQWKSTSVKLVGRDYQLFSSYKFVADGTEYSTWEALKAAYPTPANVDVKVVFGAKTGIAVGRYYVIRHKGSNRLVNLKNDGRLRTDSKTLPLASTDINYLFRFEDAGDGRYYIYSAGGDVYAKRFASMNTNTACVTTAATEKSVSENAFWVTNDVLSGNTSVFGIVGASDISNPLTMLDNTSDAAKKYWHVNTTVDNAAVIRWTCKKNATESGSHWLLEELSIPTVTVTSVIANGTEANDVPLRPTNSDAGLATQNKILSWTTALNFGGDYAPYKLIGGSLTVGGTTTNYASGSAFIAAVNALTGDATATLNIYYNPNVVDGQWYTIQSMTSESDGWYMYDNNGTANFHTAANSEADMWQAILNDDGTYYLKARSGKYLTWQSSHAITLSTTAYKFKIVDRITCTGKSETAIQYPGTQLIYGVNADRTLQVKNADHTFDQATGVCNGYSQSFKFREVQVYNITINADPSFVSGTYSWNGAELASGVTYNHLSVNPITDGTLNSVSCTAGYRFTGFTNGSETVTELNSLTGDVTLTAHYAPDVFTASTASFGEYKWMLLNNANESNCYVSAKNVGESPATGTSISYADESLLWAFVGTADNFLIYNKKLGTDYVLTSDAATPVDGTHAKMQAYDAGAAATQQWKLEGSYTSVADKPGYGLQLRNSNVAFGLNKYQGAWRFWNYNNSSTGSRWLITPVEQNFTVLASVTGTPAPNMERVARLTFNAGGQNSTVVVDGDAEYAFYTPESVTSLTVTPTQVYRGFTLADNSAITLDVDGETTATLNFTADETTKDRYIFYNYNEYVPGTGNVATRIPAIGKLPNGNLIAVADYRITGNDLGQNGSVNQHTDLLGRISTDNGHTWSEPIMVADGTGVASTLTCGYSDPAIVVNSSNAAGELIVFSVTGYKGFVQSTQADKIRVARTYSNNGGATWNSTDITDAVYAAIPTAKSIFFSSGRVLESSYRAANASYNRIYVALDVRLTDNNNNRNFVIYSDDFGLTWQTLGSNSTPAINVNGDECKVVEMPNGNILLSSRTGSGRLMAEYDMATASWSSSTSVGHSAGLLGSSNACNGEVLVVPARRASDNQPVKLLLQSVPTGNARKNVTIFYTEVDNNTTVANLAEANRWKTGIQLSNTTSAYSTMVRMNGYKVAFLFEDVNTSNGYDIVFMPLTISQITNKNYDTPFETVDIRVDMNNGTGPVANSWKNVWTSNSTNPQLTLKPSNGANNMQPTAPNIRLAAGKNTTYLDYNIATESEDWKITGYSFNFTPYSSGSNTLTVTPSGGTAVSSSSTSTTMRVSQLGLDTQTATFQMGSSANNQQILVSDFIVTLCKLTQSPLQLLNAESEAIDLDIYGTGNTTGYYPVAQRDRLLAAYNTARTMVATGWQEYDDEAVQPALDELRAAVDAMTPKMPESGRFYRIQGKFSGKYGTTTASTGNFAAMVADNDADYKLGTIFYLTEANTLLNFKHGVCITGGAQVGAVGDAGSVCEFVAGRTPAPYFAVHAGGFWMYDYGNNATYHAIARSTYDASANLKADDKYQFRLVEVNTLPLAIGQYKLATLNLPVACKLQEGVKAYRAVSTDDDLIILESVEPDGEDDMVHLGGNEPVLLYAEQGNYSISVDGDLTQGEGNDFAGTVAAITHDTADRDLMVLGVINGEVGFYPTSSSYINGFKAYFNRPVGSNAQAFRISFGGLATAIEAHESGLPEGSVYTLNGQKVTCAGNGVYIINGKKVMIR